MELPWAEPYKVKMVEEIFMSTREQRERWIKEENYNLFNLASDRVFIDLLTDSGTCSMSDKQWAEIMLGDESYAGSKSYYKLKEVVEKLIGLPYFLPMHQGRAAENVLFSILVRENNVVPGNSHFDTTKGHIEFRKARAVDCTIDEAFNIDNLNPFKGNIDLEKLEKVYKAHPKENIPFCIITITCNSSGGQPVSMKNIEAVKNLSDQYGIPVFFDAARFAENAYFIKEREEAYKSKTIKEIVKKMFSYSDGFTMSGKKNGLVNIGGLLGMRDEKLYRTCATMGIFSEGFTTNGGLAGRDLGALAQGLKESTEFSHLKARACQIEYFGNKLIEYGIPIQKPIGGHAIFVDALSFLPKVARSEYPAQTLAIELYKEAGVRGVEIGTLLADRDPDTRLDRFPKLELLRLAIPQRTYSYKHLDYVAVALKNVYDRRNDITSGLEIVWESKILRHFTVLMKQKK